MRLSIALICAASLAAVNAASAEAISDCSAQAFQDNSCAVCTTQPLPAGAGIKTVSDVVFTWKNTGTAQQFIDDVEQVKPQLMIVGSGVTSAMEPTDPSKFWQWSPQLAWVSFPEYKEYVLDAGKQVDTHMSASGSQYVITTGELPDAAPVALVKSTIAYHDVDKDFNEGPKKEYTACTLYTYAAATGAVAAPVATPEPTPAPVVAEPTVAPVVMVVSSEAKTKITSKMTKVATGPAETIVAILALTIAAAVVALRRKRA